MASFNVLNCGWIPVARLDGGREELGILDTLRRAHEFVGIRDPSPLVEFGIYRLLIAFVLDALIEAGEAPEDPLDLKDLLRKRQFNAAILEAYVSKCGNVFDLFDTERPFLQTAFTSKEQDTPARLLPTVPTAGPIHWHHWTVGDIHLGPAEAARALASISPFSIQGGRGYGTSPGGAGSYYVLPLGGSLFETLALNLPVVVDSSTSKDSTSRVAWRSTNEPLGRKRCTSALEGLTWRSRRIRLRPDAHGISSELDYAPALILEGAWRDPAVAYRYLSKKELEARQKNAAKEGRDVSGIRSADPIQASVGRMAWRDFAPLALMRTSSEGRASSQGEVRRPDVVDQAAAIYDIKQILVFALLSDQANFVHWIRTVLPTPISLAHSERYASVVESEIQMAESAGSALGRAIRFLQPRADKKKPKDLGRMLKRAAETAEFAYWKGLEPHFWNFIRAVPVRGEAELTNAEAEAAIKPWREAIRRSALITFESAADDYDTDADALERAVTSRARLIGSLRKILE